jgi:small subunit ribosomal protein S17e
MGRTKSVAVKALGNELIKEHGGLFSDDFEKNKERMAEFKKIKSKKIRNVTAGYITKEIKKIKKSGL